MDKLTEKQIEEFERLERIVIRIITKNHVSWVNFLLAMNAIIINVSNRGYTQDLGDVKKATRQFLLRVHQQMKDYYGTEKKD